MFQMTILPQVLTFCVTVCAAYLLQLSTVLAKSIATVIGPTPVRSWQYILLIKPMIKSFVKLMKIISKYQYDSENYLIANVIITVID